MRIFNRFVFCLAMLLSISCTKDSMTDNVDDTRSFYLGFTPWIYAATVEAYVDTYKKINDNGDIVQHQLMGGIPWQEALDKTPYHINVENEISGRIANTETGKIVYLSIDSMNAGRNGMVTYWGENFNEALSLHSPWDIKDFDDPDVITAYTNFSLDMINRFHPEYFCYGTEVSELILNDELKYEKYKTFAKQVYENIKAVHPDLVILISVAFKHPGSAEMNTIRTKLADISPYYDMLGISIYPYAFYNYSDKGNPANLPVEWISQAAEIAGTKSVAITETAWIAEDLILGNPAYLTEYSNPDYQNQYVEELFSEANALNAEFIIWFTVVDYNDLWTNLLNDEISKIWRDTGLYDETLAPRPALSTWQKWLNKNRR